MVVLDLLLDSWAWLEVFRKGPKANTCLTHINKATQLYTTVVNVLKDYINNFIEDIEIRDEVQTESSVEN